MKIRVKLFATFREGRGKEVYVDVGEPATPRKALDELSILIESVSILLVNGREAEADQILSQNDVISIFPPVGGG